MKINTTITTNKQKSLGRSSGWIIDSVIDQYFKVSKYNPLAGICHIKLPKELDHARKGLINIQNIYDNECFKWCLVRYLNPEDHNPRRIIKVYKDFAKRLDFKGIKFPVKIRDIYKIEKKRVPLALAFLVMKIRRIIQSMYQNNIVNKNMLTYY